MRKLKRTILLALRRIVSGDTFTVHGMKLRVPTSVDPEIRYLLARSRPYEEQEAKFVSTHLKEGTHVVELGGSIGVVSSLVRRSIGPAARHIIVEANANLVKVCGHNATIGADTGAIEVIYGAIDNSGADQVFFDAGHNAHTGRVSRSGVAVPATTLTRVSAGLPTGKAALICDIEGAELQMIRSEPDALLQFDLLILETHPDAYDKGHADLDAMMGLLKDAGLHFVEQSEDVVVLRRETA